jgi:hypothetical protein
VAPNASAANLADSFIEVSFQVYGCLLLLTKQHSWSTDETTPAAESDVNAVGSLQMAIS